MKAAVCGLTIAVLGLVGVFALRADEEKIPLDKVPKSVIDSVKKRFPNAELTGAEKENEDGKTVYEIAIKDNGAVIEIEVTAEGVIMEIEKQMNVSDLPKVVTDACESKHSGGKLQKAEQVFKVTDGKEKLEYFEIVVTTGDKKKFEVCVSPEGKIVKEEDKTKEKD